MNKRKSLFNLVGNNYKKMIWNNLINKPYSTYYKKQF